MNIDEKANIRTILLDDPNPVNVNNIKPNFQYYEDMNIHMIENEKKMTRLAIKESRLIRKMRGRRKEELFRKMKKLRRREAINRVSNNKIYPEKRIEISHNSTPTPEMLKSKKIIDENDEDIGGTLERILKGNDVSEESDNEEKIRENPRLLDTKIRINTHEDHQ